MRYRIDSLAELSRLWPGFEPDGPSSEAAEKYPFAVTPYYLSLVEEPTPSDPIYRQIIPQGGELLQMSGAMRDPLAEEELSPVPGLIHRYGDRAVLLVNGLCAAYCRHCTRKRMVGKEVASVSDAQLEEWVSYLRRTPQIRDVILSGGDPLTLSDRKLERILAAVRSVESVEIIRIGTRIPVLMPMRVTAELARTLRKYRPLWVVTHFNHSRELTEEAVSACQLLVDSGIPVNNQSVLLRGVNDSSEELSSLCRGLLRIGVRPYYLHQCDLIEGIEHLRVPIGRGIQIMEELRGRLSGLGIPLYVVDLPGGGGKVPILPNYLEKVEGRDYYFRNHRGEVFIYPDVLD